MTSFCCVLKRYLISGSSPSPGVPLMVHRRLVLQNAAQQVRFAILQPDGVIDRSAG